MAKNYADKYKQELSDSSCSSDDDGSALNLQKKKEDLKSLKKKESEVKGKSERKKEEYKIEAYTFDPRSLIESLSKPKSSHGSKPKHHEKARDKYGAPPKRDPEPAVETIPKIPKENIMQSEIPMSAKSSSKKDMYSYKKQLTPEYGQIKEKSNYQVSSKEDNVGYSNIKGESDYKSFMIEFDNEFGDHRKEVAVLSKQLVSRLKILQMMDRDLNTPNINMDILKGKLSREIGNIQDDVGEANRTIILLMNIITNIKSQFCRLKVTNEELKNYNKTFQDTIRT